MSFLQPLMLYALPVIALPIIIHLINQRRFRTIEWGAMMFLLAANRMSKGYARIRQWLILAARTLAIAGLIFAVSRPLSSGWMSLAAGGRVDTTFIVLDRSPSMQQVGLAGRSKLDSGREQLVQSLGMLRSNRWVLIDSANNRAIEIESPDVLTAMIETGPVSVSADLPGMLQTAYDYIRENRPSRSEVWMCSDVRQHDWDADSGRWQVLRDSFLELPQTVRFHLLAYPDVTPENRRVRVTSVRRVESSAGAELLISLRIEQQAAAENAVTIPVQIEVDGARSEINVELIGTETELVNHAIPLGGQQLRGWGRVSIPADANPADNEFYFVFDQPAPRKTVVVTDDPDAARPLQLAAGISPDAAVAVQVETLAAHEVVGSDWSEVALVLWQAPLPELEAAATMQSFVNRGGQIVFFPPDAPTDAEFAGLRWGEWREIAEENAVRNWIGDQDLLANAASGASLPVGGLRIVRTCELQGEHTALATLHDGAPLLARALTDLRNVSFFTTTASVGDSSLARDGVVLYVMIQRALAGGAASLGSARQLIAGEVSEQAASGWRRLSVQGDAVTSSQAVTAGVYAAGEGDGDRLFAVNRSLAEDRPAVLADERVAGLFGNLEFDRIDDRAGSGNRLLEEIWRLFLALMMAALFVEACLC
ncbi:MAG: BatA domain-containing protein, partial [Planctomycetaceae bacterium]|nr:BatA domain-containing protein [Planctomycetaceae bacterium]